jgi:hypothetical protein
LRHRLNVLQVLAAGAVVLGFACGGDEPDPQQGVFWLALSPGQGATCSSNRTFTLPPTARETITSQTGLGERLVDKGADVVTCSVAPASAAGSFSVRINLSSGEIGNFNATGVVSEAGGGQLDVSFTTDQFSLSQDKCTATVARALAGAVWIKSLTCPALKDGSSPSIACTASGGLIFENCSR